MPDAQFKRRVSTPSGRFLNVHHKDDTVDVHGVSYDATLTVYAESSRYLVVKTSGGTHWSGRGMSRAYHSPEFLIFRVVHKHDRSEFVTEYEVEPVLSFETNKLPKEKK